jgi:predicted molibdopterin-dependent oxidoreductase YjgC
MCDEGRFTYKPLGERRVVAPEADGRPVDWDVALSEAARRLRAALAPTDGAPAGTPARTIGIVASPESTNEDLHVLARLAEHFKGARVYLAGRADGWRDDILVSADKNPNAAGARAIGGAAWRAAADLARDLRAGALGALVVAGAENAPGWGLGAAAALPLDGIESLIVLAARRTAVVDAARVVLPIAMWAEADGTFTNGRNMVQRIHRAVPPAGDALPAWEALAHLGRKVGAAIDYATAKQVFLDASAKHAFMKGAEWGRPHLPVQLRFAASRG